MAYIPVNTEWYIAEVIQAISVEDWSEMAIQRILVLINAGSPDNAYEKSVKWGSEGEVTYENPHRKRVYIKFIGLGDLCAIYDPLEDGAELLYTEELRALHEDLQRFVRPKNKLTVFVAASNTSGKLDYRSGDVVDMLSTSRGQEE